MSYFNQPDHELLDRRDLGARRLLLRLAHATVDQEAPPASRRSNRAAASEATSDLLGRWMAALAEHELPKPDAEPLTLDGNSIPLVWRDHFVAALFSGSDAVLEKLRDKGFEVVVFPEAEPWTGTIAELSKLLGRSS